MQNENEIWKPIPNYEGLYEVSNLGNVKTLKYKGFSGCVKILKGCINRNGYLFVCLCKNKKRKNTVIHQLVASTFLGEKKTFCVNHKDGNKTNNTLLNLEYISTRDNVVHGKMGNPNKTSKYVGVSFHKQTGKYQAEIEWSGKRKYLGLFTTELEASEAYQKALAQIEPNTIYASKN